MQEQQENIDKEFLRQYLKSIEHSENENIICQWLDNTRKEHELFEESLRFWDEIETEISIQDYNEEHTLDKIHHILNVRHGAGKSKKINKSGFFAYLVRIAAIISIPLFISTSYLYYKNNVFGNSKSWAEIHAPYGTRTDFLLPDGSKGRLNGGSSLKFPIQFTGKAREVRLSGEAYFEVVSNSKNPFVVSTKNIDIKVTGTSFNVTAYDDEPNSEVTLKDGRVEIFKKNAEISKSIGILKPEQSFVYNVIADSGKIQFTNTTDVLSWMDGKLTFKYKPFEEIVRMLNRRYNADIVILSKSLDSYIYYGTFQDETLDEVLKLLKYTAPIRYVEYPRIKKPDGTFGIRRIEIYSINQ